MSNEEALRAYEREQDADQEAWEAKVDEHRDILAGSLEDFAEELSDRLLWEEIPALITLLHSCQEKAIGTPSTAVAEDAIKMIKLRKLLNELIHEMAIDRAENDF